jgi:hypothetical protein
MCDIRNEVLYECGKADFRDKSFCVDVSDDPAAFKHICTLRSRDRTRFVFNKLFSNAHLATYFRHAVNDGAFVQATEVSMSFVADKNALMAAAQLPHLGRLRMDKATIDKDMARCLVLFDRVSYISIKSARVVERDGTTSLALEDSITFLRLHGVTVDFNTQQRVTVRRTRQPITKSPSVGSDHTNKTDDGSDHTNKSVDDEDMTVDDEGDEDYDEDALSFGDEDEDYEDLEDLEDGEC